MKKLSKKRIKITWSCPHCREKIDYLEYENIKKAYGHAYIMEQLNGFAEALDFDEKDSEFLCMPEYFCPKCDRSIEPYELIKNL